MLVIRKYKFNNNYETLHTKNLKRFSDSLVNYRFCGGDMYMSTKFVGEWATVTIDK